MRKILIVVILIILSLDVYSQEIKSVRNLINTIQDNITIKLLKQNIIRFCNKYFQNLNYEKKIFFIIKDKSLNDDLLNSSTNWLESPGIKSLYYEKKLKEIDKQEFSDKLGGDLKFETKYSMKTDDNDESLFKFWDKEFSVNLKYEYNIDPFYKNYRESYYNDKIYYITKKIKKYEIENKQIKNENQKLKKNLEVTEKVYFEQIKNINEILKIKEIELKNTRDIKKQKIKDNIYNYIKNNQ